MPPLRVNISPMKTGEGKIAEVFMDSRMRILCPPELIPAPGQYLLAHASGSDSPLAVPVFFSDSAPNGFRSAPAGATSWAPGTRLNFRGPLGHGFAIPDFARRVALIAIDDSPARLLGLLPLAFKQGAEVVLVSNMVTDDLPEAVEIQPLQAMNEIIQWADYAAFDVGRENLNQLREKLGRAGQAKRLPAAQVLVRAPMPCGALAECGICAVNLRHDWKMTCKDGPVFMLSELLSTRS